MNWTLLGAQLRASALDAHEGELPAVDFAYSFLLENPGCFSDGDEWPADMPQEPNIELIAAYYGVESLKVHLSESDIQQIDDDYAVALLERKDCGRDEQGVFIRFSVSSEIVPKHSPNAVGLLTLAALASGSIILGYCVARWVL